MENNKHTQIPVKKIPAFTVLKNGSILKNIFLIRKQSAVDKSPQDQDSGEEILLVGRHPHCHVTLEHPSISRHHLRIHSNPSSQTLSVVDLSSVHGTWVSGRKIEPQVHVKLKEGDTVRLGGSSRVYELHWVPRSQAYHVDEQFVPAVSMIKEESDQIVEEKHEEYSSNGDPECSDLSSSNKTHESPSDPLTVLAHDYFGSDTEVEHSGPLTGNENDDIFASGSIQASPVVSETTSATQVSDNVNVLEDQLTSNGSLSSFNDTELEHSGTLTGNEDEIFASVSTHAPLVSETTFATLVSDNLNGSEDQLVLNCSKSSCDDIEVEHSCPLKADNGNVEIFTNVCTQAPLVVSEDASETEVSDCLNNLSTEFDYISHKKDEACDLFSAIETHENDDLNENVARSSEIDIDNEDQQQTDNGSNEIRDVGCEFEQLNQTKMMDESASMVLYDGVDTGFSTESGDHEIMKKESVFVLLPDVAEMDEDKTFTPDTLTAKEIHTNLSSAQKLSASMKLFDSLDGKELEFYTPEKEKNLPNACSGKSLSKQAVNPIVFGEKDIFGTSQKLFASNEGVNAEQEVDQCVNGEVVLTFSSEKESKSVQKIANSSQNFTKKRWTMVVDTDSLLDPKSLKHLKLLEGIKGTRLVAPKIVVRELMDIKSQDGFFNRDSKKASIALKWIDDSMMGTRWWIHMDDDEAANSSTAVPNVLAIALHLREQITDQKIIILSYNLTLKIKAMAEGIMCEAADEFRESLVNPFSDRFLWVGSSARGLTWSSVDDHDDILRRKYHRFGFNGSQRFKGLKLLARAKASQLAN